MLDAKAVLHFRSTQPCDICSQGHESREERAIRRSASAALASVGGLPRAGMSSVFSILAGGAATTGAGARGAGQQAADAVRAAVSSSLSRSGLVRSEYEQEQARRRIFWITVSVSFERKAGSRCKTVF